jgi:hypothetical protein
MFRCEILKEAINGFTEPDQESLEMMWEENY